MLLSTMFQCIQILILSEIGKKEIFRNQKWTINNNIFSAPLVLSLSMSHFEVPEFAQYGKRVVLKVSLWFCILYTYVHTDLNHLKSCFMSYDMTNHTRTRNHIFQEHLKIDAFCNHFSQAKRFEWWTDRHIN